MAQKTIADFQIAFSASCLRDETPPLLAWQGDPPPISSRPVNHPKMNGVNTEFSIMARKTIANFQIAFSVSNLRGETRSAHVHGTRAARVSMALGAVNDRRSLNRFFWVRGQVCAVKLAARTCMTRALRRSLVLYGSGRRKLLPIL